LLSTDDPDTMLDGGVSRSTVAIESGSNMAGVSLPGFAVSNQSKQLWATLSPAQRSAVQSLREALLAGAPVRLSNWHRLGRIAQGLSSNRSETYGQKTLDALAELAGCSSQVVGKARKFARSYTPPQAAELQAQASWEQMQRLVAINDGTVRRRLLNACRSNNWSIRQLEHEIRGRVGRQRPFGRGGRPSRRPENLQEALGDLDRLTTQIIRWYRALQPEMAVDTERSSRPFDLDQIPPQLRRRITDAVERLERVREVVQGAMDAGIGEETRPATRRG
jgi:hypothetical protein